ncbi:DUF3300 domain-containing protein, partial [Methylocystis sp.]|uniref:DUF3300 domain-containing protein n=1 Tax=Methylocystis sp. TaxID=1911079 RepID=UPI0025CE5147
MNNKKSADGNRARSRLARRLISGAACILIGMSPQTSFAIDPSPPAPTSQLPPPETPAAPATEASVRKFTQAELEKILSPIALYPDALLAQLLPASAYPLEIVQAQRWLEKNKAAAAKQDFTNADSQNWDPSVKAMLRFPSVIKKLNDDLDWTTSLGDAIINQPEDVASVIQLLRAKAQKAGALKSGKEISVVNKKEGGRDIVSIESQDPSMIYVPQYDPVALYAPSAYDGTGAALAAGLLTFGTAVAIGSAWRGNYWNWGTGAFYPPVWPGYGAWRPPYAGWRPGTSVGGGNNINIGNDVNIGSGNLPWRPDPGHRPGGRPGGIGGGNRPGDGIGGYRPNGGLGSGSGGGLGGGQGIGGSGLGGGAGGRPGGIGGAGSPKPIARPKVGYPKAKPISRPVGGRGGGALGRPGAGLGGGLPNGFGGAAVARPAGGMARPGGGGMRAGGSFQG